MHFDQRTQRALADVDYSDVDRGHSRLAYPEHEVDSIDLTTHGRDVRGRLRYGTWGSYVSDGRLLENGSVELTSGLSVRVATDREPLE